MKKIFVMAIAVLMVLGLATMGMAETEVEVDGTTTSGSFELIAHDHSGFLDIFSTELYDSQLSSRNEFHAWGSYDVTYKTEAMPGGYMTGYTGGILKTSIQAHTNSYGGFSTQFYQDFDVTGYGTFEGAIGALVEGDVEAEMNLGNNGMERSLAVTHYPNDSATALHADGTSGAYEIHSYTVVGEDIFDKNPWNVGPDIEAESNIFVSGTGGDAWMSLGYSKLSNDEGKIRHAGPAGAIGYCGPTLGKVGGTNVYVDAGSGSYSHYVHGEDYLNFEGGLCPGGGTFLLSGDFDDDGMHATPWTQAD